MTGTGWYLPSNWGILRNGNPDDPGAAWETGRLFDALRVGQLPGDPLLVASDGSGVWIANEMGGPAIPLSSGWAFPTVACLAQGSNGPQHVYAGGEMLWETDVTQPAPLLSWRLIDLVDANRHPLAFGFVNRIVVLRQLQKIVLACNFGILWAAIPPPGGAYVFSPVPDLPGRFSGLAEGPATTIVAGAWGTDLKSHHGIFVGTWSGATNSFNFTPSTILGIVNFQMRRTDIASTPSNRMRLYAICGGGNNVEVNRDPSGAPILDRFGNVTWVNDDDFILAVLRSDDGGLTWTQTGTSVTGEEQPLFPGSPSGDLAGPTQDGYTGCVGISPFNPDIVAVGVVKPFLSIDGGASWVLYDQTYINSHLHDDTHALVFDPADGSTLHVCCDGGLATTPDLGGTWRSTANRQMPIQEVYDFSESSKDSGLIAASLQDNGNIYAPLYINAEPWRILESGDGEVVLFLSNGDLVRQNNELTIDEPSGKSINYGHQLRAAWWDNDARLFHDRSMFPDPPLSFGVIPIDGFLDGLSIPKDHCICKIITPLHVNADNEPMMAVAAVGTGVLGMFVKPDGTSHWHFIGEIPFLPDKGPGGDPLPYFATAVQSPDGTYVFVGTNNGKIFRLDAPLFLVTNLSDPVVSNQITDIVAFVPDQAVLIAATDVFRREAAGWKLLSGKVVGGVKLELPANFHLIGLAADPTTVPPQLYVAVDAPLNPDPTLSGGVFKSEDFGETWFSFNDGLPTQPRCRDLRWVKETSGVTFLNLATFGWSVFRRPLNFEPSLFPLTVNGHMDIVHAFALFTHNVIVHPTFSASRMLGPLHPFEEVDISKECDDAVGVELKLKFAWKLDFSVVMDVYARLIDLDSGDQDASWGTTVSIPSGTSELVTIDMEAGGLAPDSAHVEFTVQN
jgi:hypothetical protein